jgi:hypothetical protein
MEPEPIILRPEQTSFIRVPDLSEKIVQSLVNYGYVDVIGISSAIFLACGAVNMSRHIANVNVKTLAADYIDIPIVGKFDAIFFHLTKEIGIDFDTEIKKWDTVLNEGGNQAGKIVTVSKAERPERLTTIALMKLSNNQLVKIAAAGTTINTAVSMSLQLTRANISKFNVGIAFIGLNSIQQRNNPNKSTTALQIYIGRGVREKIDDNVQRLIEKLKKGR